MSEVGYLDALSNKELRAKCLEYELPNVPVTDSNRNILIRRLIVAMNGGVDPNKNKNSKRRETFNGTKQSIVAKPVSPRAAPKNVNNSKRKTIATVMTKSDTDEDSVKENSKTSANRSVTQRNFLKASSKTFASLDVNDNASNSYESEEEQQEEFVPKSYLYNKNNENNTNLKYARSAITPATQKKVPLVSLSKSNVVTTSFVKELDDPMYRYHKAHETESDRESVARSDRSVSLSKSGVLTTSYTQEIEPANRSKIIEDESDEAMDYEEDDGTAYTYTPPAMLRPSHSYITQPSVEEQVFEQRTVNQLSGVSNTFGGASATYGSATTTYGGSSNTYGSAPNTYEGLENNYGGTSSSFASKMHYIDSARNKYGLEPATQHNSTLSVGSSFFDSNASSFNTSKSTSHLTNGSYEHSAPEKSPQIVNNAGTSTPLYPQLDTIRHHTLNLQSPISTAPTAIQRASTMNLSKQQSFNKPATLFNQTRQSIKPLGRNPFVSQRMNSTSFEEAPLYNNKEEIQEDDNDDDSSEEEEVDERFNSNFARNLEQNLKKRNSARHAETAPKSRRSIKRIDESDDLWTTLQQFFRTLDEKYHITHSIALILCFIFAVFIYVFFIQ